MNERIVPQKPPATAERERIVAQFTRDMQAAGFEVVQYSGRDIASRGSRTYSGPAVHNAHYTDALRATSLSLQWDRLGKSIWVVYPVLP